MNEAVLAFLGKPPKSKPIPSRVNLIDEDMTKRQVAQRKPYKRHIRYSRYRTSIIKLLKMSPGPVTTAVLAKWLGVNRNSSSLATTLHNMAERKEISMSVSGRLCWWRG